MNIILYILQQVYYVTKEGWIKQTIKDMYLIILHWAL